MTPGHRARCLAATAALLIAACGSQSSSSPSGGSSSSPSGEPSSSPSGEPTGTSPPLGCTNPYSAYGAVCTATPPAAVGASTAAAGSPIHKGNTIGTQPGGDITFWISDKIKKCQIYNSGTSGKLIIWPAGAPQVLIHYLAGATACSTLFQPGYWHFAAGSHANITLNDPVWVVLIDQTGAVTIQVFAGSLMVSTDTGQGPVTVTALHQVTVDASGNLSSPVELIPGNLSKQELDAVQQVER